MLHLENPLYTLATWLVPLALAIVAHEIGHDSVARMLGDESLAQAGKRRFDPRRYVDPVGTIALPMMLVLLHAPVFGWARSSPTDVSRFRNPRVDKTIWALAGPFTNLFLGTLSVGAIALLAGGRDDPAPGEALRFMIDNLFHFAQVNLFLAVFNLLPIYPFDGGHALEGLLPRKAAAEFRQLERFGLPLLLVMFVVLPAISPSLDFAGRFVRAVTHAILAGELESLDLLN